MGNESNNESKITKNHVVSLIVEIEPKSTTNELTKLPENVVPRIFPTYSPNPKGSNFGLYCKYQLLRYKPWTTTQNNAWGDQEPSDDILTNHWHEFLQTPYGQTHVPDWFDKLRTVIQSHQELEGEPCEEQGNTREEWMILSDLHTPFENSEQTLSHHMTGIKIEHSILSNKFRKCQHESKTKKRIMSMMKIMKMLI